MNRYFSAISFLLLVRGSLSVFNRVPRILPTLKFPSSSTIKDENNFDFFDKCIYNPIFFITSTYEEKYFGKKLHPHIDENLKGRLKILKYVSLAGFFGFGCNGIFSPYLAGKALNGILSLECLRASYNAFSKNYCKIIGKQNAFDLGEGWLSKAAYYYRNAKMLNEISPNIIFYRTITLRALQLFKQVYTSMSICVYR